jgi:hypothetical protein
VLEHLLWRDGKDTTWAGVFASLADPFARDIKRPFDFAVVDEAQDIGIAEARFRKSGKSVKRQLRMMRHAA